MVVKYQLLFFYWKNNDFHEFRPNIKLTDIAKSVVWHGQFLYVGLRNQYIQVSIELGQVKELFPIVTEPLMLSLNTSGSVGVLGSGASPSGLALCREKQTFIFDSDAKPLLDYPVTWSDQPISIANDSLFLLSILANDSSVEVLTTSASKILPVQKISLPTPSVITKPLKCIAKWRNRSGQLLCHSENDVVLLKAVAREQQIKVLQNEKYFELALKVSVS